MFFPAFLITINVCAILFNLLSIVVWGILSITFVIIISTIITSIFITIDIIISIITHPLSMPLHETIPEQVLIHYA
jgi:hypothetical protein